MPRRVARRLLQMVLTMLLATSATFLLIHAAPGDPVQAAMSNPNISESVRARWRVAYGLDRPLPEQYGRYLAAVARGELGFSISQHRPVRDALADALPYTIVLIGVALLASFGAGVTLGILQAARRRSRFDRIVSRIALVFYSVPDFWLAVVILLGFAYWIRLFPVGGSRDPLALPSETALSRVRDLASHLVLPVLTLALLTTAGIARYQRAAMLEEAHRDYVRTARAKGAAERAILIHHVFRNALLPLITLLGLSLPGLVAGAALIESVFSWPGMGFLTVNAIGTRDYPMITAIVIVGSGVVCVGSLLADVLYVIADPRLRD